MRNFSATGHHQRLVGQLIVSLTFCFLSICAGPSWGAQPIDSQAIIRETQQVVQTPQKLVLVWWVPEEFWRANLERNPNLPPENRERLLGVFRNYTMVLVIDGKLGPVASLSYSSEAAIRANLTVLDTQGGSYSPIKESDVDPDMKNLIQIFKPILANALGPMGQNMNFFLFQTKDRHAVVKATDEGKFDVVLAEQTFSFRLPLGSILPPKFDAQSGEKFPGNFVYSPYSGAKLVSQP